MGTDRTVIRIQEQSEQDDGFRTAVSFDYGPPYPITVRNPFTEEQEKELEWYFEKHLRFPYTKKVRAKEAATSIIAYGETLFQQVFQENHQVIFPYKTAVQAGLQRIIVESPTLKPDEAIPREYTADGRNVSPPLSWRNAPAGAKEFAVVLEDPDAGNPPPFVHWVMYKIPATARSLPENIPFEPGALMPAEVTGAIQGTSGFRRAIYRGPAPPPGPKVRRPRASRRFHRAGSEGERDT